MEKPPKIIADQIHLLKIEVVTSELDIPAFQKATKPELGIAHKLMHNLKDEMLKIELVCIFNNKEKEQLMRLQTDYHFKIEKLEKFYTIKEEKPIFHAQLIATILGISVSTARGILFQKLEDNGIHNIIIPVISPHNILTQSN